MPFFVGYHDVGASRVRYVYLLMVILLSGCASSKQKSYTFDDWAPIGYKGFLESINQSTGNNSINCGFHDLLTPEGKKSKKEGFLCAIQHAKKGITFKYGTRRLPIDSFAYEILIGKSSSEYWFVVYDIMIDGDAPQQWVEKCSAIKFRKNHERYEDKNCSKVNNEKWP